MYRCTECQEEFKEKPKYCNCGNDEFEEIPNPNSQTAASAQTSAPEKPHPSIHKYPLNNLFPVGFFVICVILSISVWFIKIQPSKPQKSQTFQPAQTQNIPADVDIFWQDSAAQPYISKEQKQETIKPQPAETISEAQPQQTAPKTPSKPVSKPVQKQPAATAKPAQQPKHPQSPPVQQTSQQTKTPQNPKLPESVLNLNKPETQTTAQPQPKPAEKPDPPQMSSAEFLKYKGEIRSALLAKLNITAIQGSGDCAVEFSLDSTGKLINRNFIYKSSNKSVNDEVYLMLMRLPYYKQPPQYYNGEKIKLKFYFNNGYYEITFI